MDNGWIKLHRKIIDTGFFSNPELSHFWIWCLLKATHKETKTTVGYKTVILQPGQFVFGRIKAALATGLSERQIRTSLDYLRILGNLRLQTTNKFTIVTICNWEVYQNPETSNDQQDVQQTTNKRPANDQQTTTYKNDKNVKNERSEEVSNHPFFDDADFKDLWESWMDTRKKMKVPNTPHAMILSLNKLASFGIDNAKMSLAQSIERGWRGVFEPKRDFNSTGDVLTEVQKRNVARMQKFDERMKKENGD